MDFVRRAAPVISAQQLGIARQGAPFECRQTLRRVDDHAKGQLAAAAVGREVSRKAIKSKASIEYAWGGVVKSIPIVNTSYSEDPRKWLGGCD